MPKTEEKIVVEGEVVEAMPSTTFRVKLPNGHVVLAYLSGRLRKNYIRILLGDRVKLALALRPDARPDHLPFHRASADRQPRRAAACRPLNAALPFCVDPGSPGRLLSNDLGVPSERLGLL